MLRNDSPLLSREAAKANPEENNPEEKGCQDNGIILSIPKKEKPPWQICKSKPIAAKLKDSTKCTTKLLAPY